MENTTEVDVDTWARKEHYSLFMQMEYPQYGICFDLDVSGLVLDCRQNARSFYHSLIFHSMACVNRVPAFRYRARGGKVVLHDRLHPSFTDIGQDSDLFRIVTLELPDTLDAFVVQAREKSRKQIRHLDFTGFEGRDDLVYFTSIPWISFTQLTHPVMNAREDAVPRLSWGKYREESGRFILPYAVQVHHAFVDGIHLGRFKTMLEGVLGTFS